MKYIPDDMKESFLKENSFIILRTLYQVWILELIKATLKGRKSEYNNDRNDIIEVTEEAIKEIESIDSYKSMLYIKNIKIAASGRGLSFLKIKAIGK